MDGAADLIEAKLRLHTYEHDHAHTGVYERLAALEAGHEHSDAAAALEALRGELEALRDDLAALRAVETAEQAITGAAEVEAEVAEETATEAEEESLPEPTHLLLRRMGERH